MTDPAHHSLIEDIQGILFGVVMAALGIHILNHMGFMTGQTVGLAVLLVNYTGLPFPVAYFGLSLPFLLLGYRRLGARFAVKTLLTTALLSGLTAVLPHWVGLGRIEPAVAACLFGLLFGIAGLAVVRHGGSFGGISIVWLMLQDRTGFQAGYAQLIFDVALFAVAAWGMDPELLAYSFLGAAVFALFLAINHRRDRYVVA